MSSSRDALTLSREDLYELVWSKPMVELAKDFGLSDVALAKRCRKLGVPVPGRGYWARVSAGQTPRQAPLKKRAEKDEDYSALTFAPPREQTENTPEEIETPERTTLRERLQSLDLTFNEDLRNAAPAVKRTAMHLKRPWCKEIIWNRSERTGPILSINVTESSLDRALSILNRLISTAEAIGWPFKNLPPVEQVQPNRYGHEEPAAKMQLGCLYVEKEPLTIRIDERQSQIDHVLTEEEKLRRKKGQYVYLPRWDHVPTGELRLHVTPPHARYTKRTWKDGKRIRIENQINAVLIGMFEEALKLKAEREQRRLDEIARRREEELRWQLSQRRSANAELIHELEAQAGAWMRARLLRAYLRALKRTPGADGLQAKRRNEWIDFFAWADHYIDQLDPLSPAPHDPDLQEDRWIYQSTDTEVSKMLSRLLGRHWQDSWKVGCQSQSPSSPSEVVFGHAKTVPAVFIPSEEDSGVTPSEDIEDFD